MAVLFLLLVTSRIERPIFSSPHHPPIHRPRAAINLAWLIVPCLACDFWMMPVLPVMENIPRDLGCAIVSGIVGCVLAQGCLLAAFLAWSEGPFLLRLLRHWIVAAGLFVTWLVGLALAPPPDGAAQSFAATVALGVPLVSIAAQFPLWLARQFWGWRLMYRADIPAREPTNTPLPLDERGWRPGKGGEADTPVCQTVAADRNACPEPAAEQADRKLAIRDLMLATMLVALSLALARLAPADGKDVWPVWAVSCAVAAVISSITMLPAGAWLMRPAAGRTFLSATLFAADPLRPGLVWSVLYAAAWVALVWVILAAQWWFALPRAPRPIYIGISSFILSFASTLILTTLIARARGYRLTNGPNRSARS